MLPLKRLLEVAVLFGAVVVASGVVRAAEPQQPAWAYAIPPTLPPGAPPAPAVRDDGKLFSLPGTDRKFTLNQIRGRLDDDTLVRTAPADWYPGDHPQMPKIVAEGDNSRGVVACALCHYPNGKGRPENASPAGLPKDYIVGQMHDFRVGLRRSSEPLKANAQTMIDIAKGMTEEEIQAAASYYSSMPWTPWIRVVEARTVPKTRSEGGIFVPLEGAAAGTEPMGGRIIETPENAERTETLRDPRSGFVAYVPIGAVAKGNAIVRSGGGKTIQCAICHGEHLQGIGSVPGIAARSPSYIVRQLRDIQQGARNGVMAALMKPVVATLTADDMLNIAAYTASLPAPAPSAASRGTAPPP